jgi:hypothetical protein
MVIDPKESFSKQALFQEGWENHYKGMVEWLGPKVHDGLKSVDPKTGTVVTGFETYKNAALVNVIPAQMAGAIARDAGLANATGYCAIDPANMKSTADANIFVLGDACIAGDMPKSAFSANSQAKVAAMMIRGELVSARTFPARYTNTCWSLIDTDDCVKVGGAYEPKDGKIAASSTFISKTGEDAALRKQTQAENMGWYAGITADMFADRQAPEPAAMRRASVSQFLTAASSFTPHPPASFPARQRSNTMIARSLAAARSCRRQLCRYRQRSGRCRGRKVLQQVPCLPSGRRNGQEQRRPGIERPVRPQVRQRCGLQLFRGQQELRHHLG